GRRGGGEGRGPGGACRRHARTAGVPRTSGRRAVALPPRRLGHRRRSLVPVSHVVLRGTCGLAPEPPPARTASSERSEASGKAARPPVVLGTNGRRSCGALSPLHSL